MAGKGSARRHGNSKKYKENYDKIFSKKCKTKPGRYVIVDGELVDVKNVVRQGDGSNVNFKSIALGCHPSQSAEFNKLYSKHGVKFDKEGTCIIKDRQSKFRLMREFKMHDNDEVR